MQKLGTLTQNRIVKVFMTQTRIRVLKRDELLCLHTLDLKAIPVIGHGGP
jgi:hypothetical protein